MKRFFRTIQSLFTQQKKSFRQPRIHSLHVSNIKFIMLHSWPLCSAVVNFAKLNDKRSGVCEGESRKNKKGDNARKGEVIEEQFKKTDCGNSQSWLSTKIGDLRLLLKSPLHSTLRLNTRILNAAHPLHFHHESCSRLLRGFNTSRNFLNTFINKRKPSIGLQSLY